MKEIQIFLASSSELATDRARIGNLVRKLNEEMEKRFIHLHLVKWEDHDSFYNQQGKQGEYDHLIRYSDFFIALFWHVAGGYTVHEVDVARENNLPVKIYRSRSPVAPNLEENADVQWLAGHSSGEDLEAFLAGQPDVTDYASFDELAADLTAALKQFCEGITVGEEEKRPYSPNELQIHAVASPEVEPDLAKLGDLVRYLDENSRHYCRIKMIDVIPGSDLFVSLCHTSAPDPVPGEIGQAIECNRHAADARPKLFFCLKKADDSVKEESLKKLESMFAETFSHFPDRYAQSAELRFHFLLELERLKKDCYAVTLTVEDGIIWQQNGESKTPLMRCEDMVSLRKDPGYIALKAERDRLLNEIEKLKEKDRCSEESLAAEIHRRFVKLEETKKDIASKESGHLRLMRTLEEQVGREQDEEILKLRGLILNGRLEEALVLLPDNRSLEEQWNGDWHLQCAKGLRMIAACELSIEVLSASNAKKNYDKIVEYYQLAIRIAYNLRNDEKEAEIRNVYASFLYDWGKYDDALKAGQEALDICLRIHGENYPATAGSYNNIGVVWCDKGDYDRALEFHQKALGIRLRVLGENHPDTAMSYNNIGVAWDEKGDHDRALEFHQKALDIRLRVLGENHPATAGSYNNIGVIWKAKCGFDEALEFYQKALDIYLRVYGENHPATAVSYINIGNVWGIQGKFEQALDFFQKALDIYLRVYGENHPATAATYNKIGAAWANKGDHNGGFHFLFWFSGVVSSDNSDYTEAEKNFRRAYEIAKHFPGDRICAGLIQALSYLDDPE